MMDFLIKVFHGVTFAIALSAVLCATTTPPNNEWSKKAYRLMNIAAFNVWKSEDKCPRMDVGSVSDTAQISWRQIAVQQQERLRTGAEGETVREAVETILPTVYTKQGNKVEAQPLAPTQRVNVSV